MPEGDTVWRTARHLHEALAGRQLLLTDLRVPQYAALNLSGQVVHDAVSRGKHLLVHIGDRSLHTHLRMEGAWHIYRRGTAWRRPAHTARVVLQNADYQAVGFSLGIVEMLARRDEPAAFAHLGPDLLGADWGLDEAVRRVGSEPDRSVFLALHDQRNLAGFGNEYVNELCFLTGLLPTRRVGDVPDLRRMIERGRRMIEANSRRVQRSFTGSLRAGEQHWVFAREHTTCRRCGTRLRSGHLGDHPTRLRNTFWCPHCQS